MSENRTFEVVHVEPKYRYMSYMEQSTMFENIEDEKDLSKAFSSQYPDHVVLATVEMTA